MSGVGVSFGTLFAVGILVLWLLVSVRIIQEYERGVMLFFGRFSGVKKPGLRVVLAPFFRMTIIDMRTIARDVDPQDVITEDNVSVKVSAVIFFRVIYPDKAFLQVEDFLYATLQLAQTTLRSVVGQHSLDELLSKRDKLNLQIAQILDQHTDPWGIKVANVEIKHVDLPPDMQRVMARQAEAERERRAKIIAAEGEFQAAQKLTDAANVLASQPAAIQLRYLQTLVEIAAENNSTTVFPVPIDLLKPFLEKAGTK